MARALDVTHATLIRHFGSKEALLAEVVEHLRTELLAQIETDAELKAASSSAELMHALWRRFSEPKEQRQFLLLAEIYGLAIRDRGRFEDLLESTVHDFIAPIEEKLIQDGWPPDDAPAVATTLLAQVRGLQLDVAATGDRGRVDQAFAVMLEALLVRR